jgi:Co/Zn/Cd efflux system component
MHYAERPKVNRTLGNHRAEEVGALGSLIVIWLLCAMILQEALSRMSKILKGEEILVES